MLPAHCPATIPMQTFSILAKLINEDPESPCTSPRVEQKPPAASLAGWVGSVAKAGGVLAALPRAAWTTEAGVDDHELRVVRLGGNAGSRKWWLRKLGEARWDERCSLSMATTQVHCANGLDDNGFFPEARHIDARLDGEGFELLSLPGFEARVTKPGHTEATHLALEAAALGVAPAVFAELHVAGAQGRSCRITVSQAPAFHLGDLLAAHVKCRADPLLRPAVGDVESTVYESALSIGRKVRALAEARVLKLDLAPHDVVFCPRLVENEQGDLEASGFGFRCPSKQEVLKGVPHVGGFGGLVRRIDKADARYDADAAHATMILALAASVRAEYGAATAQLVLNRLSGKAPGGAILPQFELPDGFSAIGLNQCLERVKAAGGAAGFGELLRSGFAEHAEVAADFERIVETGVGGAPVFGALVRGLLASSAAATSLAPVSAAAEEAALAEAHRVDSTLQTVRSERQNRLRARVREAAVGGGLQKLKI